jgi:hypothetical protein
MSAQVSSVEITTVTGTETFSESSKNDLLYSMALFTISRKFRRKISGYGRKHLWLNLRFYPSICSERLRRT